MKESESMFQTIKEPLKAVWPVTIRRFNEKSSCDSADLTQLLKQNQNQHLQVILQALDANRTRLTDQFTGALEHNHITQTKQFDQAVRSVEQSLLALSESLSHIFETKLSFFSQQLTKLLEQSESLLSERASQLLETSQREQFEKLMQALGLCEKQLQDNTNKTVEQSKNTLSVKFAQVLQNSLERTSANTIAELKMQNDSLKNQLLSNDFEQKKLIAELKNQNDSLKNQLLNTDLEQKKLIAELKSQNDALKKQLLSTESEQKKLATDVQTGLKDIKKQSTDKLTAVSREVSRYRNELAGRIFEPRPNYMEGLNRTPREKKIIVSLTSYSKRIEFIAPCVYTLLHQTMKPDMVILWLAESDFPHRNADLPQALVKLQEIGLSIEWCEELRPHKKYYEAMKRWPDDIIITVDDDVIYPAQLVESLFKAHQKHPESVCTTRVRQIRTDENGQLLPYNDWTLFEGPGEKGPALNLLPTGVGGILYPPHCLDKQVFNKEEFKELCLFNDDLWLKLMQLKKGTPVFKLNWPYPWITYVEGSQENSLWTINMGKNQNDLCLDKMKHYFSIKMPALADIWSEAASD